jgi:hypothetical protein
VKLKLISCKQTTQREKNILNNQNATLNMAVPRLLYLFLADFLCGFDLSVLTFKDRLDRRFVVSGNSSIVKTLGLMIVCIGVNMLMLGYTMYFAVTASTKSQVAWCVTFALWIFVEIVFVSNVEAMWTHVFVPSFSYSVLKRNKNAVIRHLISDRDYSANLSTFNAASHFFVSHQLAASLTQIQSDAKAAILKFSTPWPREQFIAQGVIPAESEASGLLYRLVNSCVSMHTVAYELLISLVISIVMSTILVLLGPFYDKNSVAVLVLAGLLVTVVGGVYMAGIVSSTANDSLSLMNKKWDSVMCPQGDSNDMTWHIKEQFSNENFDGEYHVVGLEEVDQVDTVDVGLSSARLQLMDRRSDNTLNEIVLGDDDRDEVESNHTCDERVLSAVLCVESYDVGDKHEAMI